MNLPPDTPHTPMYPVADLAEWISCTPPACETMAAEKGVGAAGLAMQAACLSAFVFAKGPLFGAACNAMYNFFSEASSVRQTNELQFPHTESSTLSLTKR